MRENIKNLVKNNIKNQLNGVFTAPVVISGSPGISKSTMVKDLAKELNYHIVSYSVPSLDTSELSGIPDHIDAYEMDKFDILEMKNSKATKWSVPEIIYRANTLAKEKPVILLLDDIHSINKAVAVYLYGLLLDRTLGQYKLSNNVAIVATMNNSEEADFAGFSSAIINRMAFIDMKVNTNEFIKGYGKRFHYYVKSFLEKYPKYLIEQEDTETPFATPRSWEWLSNDIKTLDKDFFLENINMIASQYISEEATKAFNGHVTFINKIDLKSVLQGKPFIVTSKPIDEQTILPYIAEEIETLEELKTFVEMLNINFDNKSFIGFTMGNIADLYNSSNSKPLSKAVQVFLSLLLDIEMPKLTSNETKLVKQIKIEHIKELIAITSDYLLDT